MKVILQVMRLIYPAAFLLYALSTQAGDGFEDGTNMEIIAGTDRAGYSCNGFSAEQAALHAPTDVVADPAGNLYVADFYNHTVRKIDPNGIIRVVAGTGESGYSGDGGPADAARLNSPYSISVDDADNLYIADRGNKVIRKVDATGIITTVAGPVIRLAEDPPDALSWELSDLTGIAAGSGGDVYIATESAAYRLEAAGDIHQLTDGMFGFMDVAYNPATGEVFLLDHNGANRVQADGTTQPLTTDSAGEPVYGAYLGMALDEAGNVYLSEIRESLDLEQGDYGRITQISPQGTMTIILDGEGKSLPVRPTGLTVGSAGSVYVADSGAHRLYRLGDVLPARVTEAQCAAGRVGFSSEGPVVASEATEVASVGVVRTDLAQTPLRVAYRVIDGETDTPLLSDEISWGEEDTLPIQILEIPWADDEVTEGSQILRVELVDDSVNPPRVLASSEVRVLDDDQPALGQGVPLGSRGGGRFFGGLSVDEGMPLTTATWHVRQQLDLHLQFTPLAAHISREAEIITVLYAVEADSFFMVDGEGAVQPWDLRFDTLSAAMPAYALTQTQLAVIPLSGLALWEAGDSFLVLYGYRTAGGEILFNGEQPLVLNVSREAAGSVQFSGEVYTCQPPADMQLASKFGPVHAAGGLITYITRNGGSGGAVSVTYSGTALDMATIPDGTVTWAHGDSTPKPVFLYLSDAGNVLLELHTPTGGSRLGEETELVVRDLTLDSFSGDSCPGAAKPVVATLPEPFRSFAYIITVASADTALDQPRAFLYEDGRLHIPAVEVAGLGTLTVNLLRSANDPALFTVSDAIPGNDPARGTYFDPADGSVTLLTLHVVGDGCYGAELVLMAEGAFRLNRDLPVSCY